MSGACNAGLEAGVIRGVLGVVDCQTREFAQAGYQALTTGSSPFQTALTALLTVYVAVVGYRLLFATDGARLSDAPGIALKIGAVLAMVTSWSVFQTLVFDLAAKAPLEMARLVAGPLQARDSALTKDPMAGLQLAYDQLANASAVFGKLAGPTAKAYTSGEAAAAEALATASSTLFVSTAGTISVATIALGVLTAIGPIFVTLFLFRQTRGLFVGWVRAMIAAALTPMAAWIMTVMLLSALEPSLVAMAQQRQDNLLDIQTALTAAAIVFVFAAGQGALMIAGLVIALGFKLDLSPRSRSEAVPGSAQSPASQSALELSSRNQRLAQSLQVMANPETGVDRRTAWAMSGGTMDTRSGSSQTLEVAPAASTYRRPAFQSRRMTSAGDAQ